YQPSPPNPTTRAPISASRLRILSPAPWKGPARGVARSARGRLAQFILAAEATPPAAPAPSPPERGSVYPVAPPRARPVRAGIFPWNGRGGDVECGSLCESVREGPPDRTRLEPVAPIAYPD